MASDKGKEKFFSTDTDSDGNVIGIEIPDGNFMATPTRISKSFITPEKLVIINENGEVMICNNLQLS